MANILAIDTTTKNCSVAIFSFSKLLALKESNSGQYVHSEKLNLYIKESLAIAKINLKNIDAIAISNGPGSYTGLRIGVSTAKALCYALNVPLISISTLKAMAIGVPKNDLVDIYCPMLDARRNEVYTALFDRKNNEIREVKADILDANSYKSILKYKVLFFGEGSLKCRKIISNTNALFINDNIYPSAKYFGVLANQKFKNNDFEDTAYFEPFYLKDFVLGKKS